MNTVIGLDYGTQSARAVLADADTGEVLLSHAVRYPHGVMPGDLASAQDYEDALTELLAAVTPRCCQWKTSTSTSLATSTL